MASQSKFCFLLFLLLFTSRFCESKTSYSHQHKVLNVSEISHTLANKGYTAMSLTLEMVLKSLIPPEVIKNDTVTIFCPPDKAFFSLKYPQPPLTLLQYHVAPSELDKEALESRLRLGSRIDTLLPGHPLVVTTMPDSKKGSINEVKITEWDLYNDGHVIVHAIEDFFDPSYQTLRYPQYDGGVSNGKDRSSAREDGLDVKGSSEEGGRFSSEKDVVKGMNNMSLLVIAFGFLVFATVYLGHLYRQDHGFLYLK